MPLSGEARCKMLHKMRFNYMFNLSIIVYNFIRKVLYKEMAKAFTRWHAFNEPLMTRKSMHSHCNPLILFCVHLFPPYKKLLKK